jgi:hypothetical protein
VDERVVSSDVVRETRHVTWFFTHIFTGDINFLKGSLRDAFLSRSALKG